MCGIVGVVELDAVSSQESLARRVSAMTRQLRHRGPDDEGIWLDQKAGVALGHRRLAIVDLSPAGHQPMISADGSLVVVYNGEIYNADDPRRPGASPMLEVPMSITPCGGLLGLWIERHVGERSLPRRALERAYPLTRWLRPNGRNRADLLWVLSEIRRRPGTHAEFMLHSSELMPGGSPTFRDEASIERLYDDLEALFAAAEGDFYGSTLSEFRNLWVERTTRSRPSRSPGLDEAPTARAEA